MYSKDLKVDTSLVNPKSLVNNADVSFVIKMIEENSKENNNMKMLTASIGIPYVSMHIIHFVEFDICKICANRSLASLKMTNKRPELCSIEKIWKFLNSMKQNN